VPQVQAGATRHARRARGRDGGGFASGGRGGPGQLGAPPRPPRRGLEALRRRGPGSGFATPVPARGGAPKPSPNAHASATPHPRNPAPPKVATEHLRGSCKNCGGYLANTVRPDVARKRLVVFRNLAAYHRFELLQQVAEHALGLT
jgi:hypothetical protein